MASAAFVNARIVIAACAAGGIAAACGGRETQGLRNTCFSPVAPGVVVALPSLDVVVRDRGGRGIALGSTISVDGAAQQVPLQSDTAHAFLIVPAGTYTVHIGKQFYHDTSIANVGVLLDQCGRTTTTTVDVALDLLPDAPDFRSVDILGARFLGEPGDQDTLRAYFDAAPNVSRSVTWRIADTTIASLSPDGIVTDKCTLAGGTETVTLVPAADTTRKQTARFSVAPRTFCP